MVITHQICCIHQLTGIYNGVKHTGYVLCPMRYYSFSVSRRSILCVCPFNYTRMDKICLPAMVRPENLCVNSDKDEEIKNGML